MKNELKDKILAQRESLEEPIVKELSGQVVKNLSLLDQYRKSRMVMYYVSFKKEVQTHRLVDDAFSMKKVVVPKIVAGVIGKEIVPSLILSMDQLVEGYAGILEPMEALKVNYKNIDLVIVPGVVFDIRGHRIGYRHGHYDKFLKNVPKAIKIGLAYDFQMVDEIPEEPHDIPMDFVVTEKRVYDCRAQQ